MADTNTEQSEQVSVVPPSGSGNNLTEGVFDVAGHFVAGFLLFVLLTAFAVSLDWALQSLSKVPVSPFILYWLGLVDVVVFALDIFLFVYYLVNISWHFIRSLRWR